MSGERCKHCDDTGVYADEGMFTCPCQGYDAWREDNAFVLPADWPYAPPGSVVLAPEQVAQVRETLAALYERASNNDTLAYYAAIALLDAPKEER